METRGVKVADGAAAERIKDLASFYDTMQTAMEQTIAADTERADRAT
jgi:hypothetical protein